MIVDHKTEPICTHSTFCAWPHEVEKTRGCNPLESVAFSSCQSFRHSGPPGPRGTDAPPAAPLEFPTAGQRDDVLGRAQGEGLNGERRGVPGALAGKHTRIGDEQVRHIVGAPERGDHRVPRLRSHATCSSDVGRGRRIVRRDLPEHLDRAGRGREFLDPHEHRIQGQQIELRQRRCDPHQRNAVRIHRLGQGQTVSCTGLLLGNPDKREYGTELRTYRLFVRTTKAGYLERV